MPATMSHKVLRLVSPWALLGVLGASLWQAAAAPEGPAATAARVLLAGQLAFWATAAAGPRAGAPGRLARTFAVLNAATLVALWRFATGRQAVTW